LETNRWLFLLGAFFLLGLVLHSPYIVALSTAVLVVLAAAHWWQAHSLDGVIYRRRFHFKRGFPGERFPVRMEIENHKFLPLSWLRVQDPWPKVVGPEDEEVLAPTHIEDTGLLTSLVSLRWYERTKRSHMLLYRRRGVYKIGPATLESGDLFGIYQKRATVEPVESITVFPTLLPLEQLNFPAENPFGDTRSHRRLFEDPNRPMGVREYHPEDGFRRVHWPATARTGQLQVKLYQPISSQVLAICLNVSTFLRHWEGYHPARLERMVSLTATYSKLALDEGYQVGLFSNGCLSNSDQPFRIPPGRSPQKRAPVLTALAGVTPLTIAPFESYLLREVPTIPYGALLLIITSITSPEMDETLLRLKRHERRITLVSLSEKPPSPLPGIHSIHLPFYGD
jgi:uncharacterized protein (DUF58 family)